MGRALKLVKKILSVPIAGTGFYAAKKVAAVVLSGLSRRPCRSGKALDRVEWPDEDLDQGIRKTIPEERHDPVGEVLPDRVGPIGLFEKAFDENDDLLPQPVPQAIPGEKGRNVLRSEIQDRRALNQPAETAAELFQSFFGITVRNSINNQHWHTRTSLSVKLLSGLL